MRILSVHNQFRKYAGSDIVAAADEQLFAQHADVTSYTRHRKEIESATQLQRLRVGPDTLYCPGRRREISEVVEPFPSDNGLSTEVFPLGMPSLYHALHRLEIPS